jgi:hypothetical protein
MVLEKFYLSDRYVIEVIGFSAGIFLGGETRKAFKIINKM